MKIRTLTLFIVTLLAGCTYSVRESMIKSDIPPSYQHWSGGIRTILSTREIDAAVQFGRSCKEKPNVLEYAYIAKPDGITALNSTAWYVNVKTPMYLISKHSLQQAREYRDIDQPFLDYCKTLRVAAIDVWAQSMSFNRFTYGNVYGRGYSIIVLRDGKRVEPIHSFSGYKGVNPFMDIDPKFQNMIHSSMEQAKASLASLTPEQKAAIEKQWGKGSMDPDVFEKNMPSWSPTENVFRVDDLLQAGQYTIVVRSAKTNNMFSTGDQERRFSIDFSKFM